MACKHVALGLLAAALCAPVRAAGAEPRGDFAVVPPAWRAPAADRADPELSRAEGDRVFYLNRGGGEYAPGFNDSRNDRSSLVEETSQIPAWDISDAEWAEVMGCVEELFAEFRVRVTDSDPGGAAHIEAVIGGRYGDLRGAAPGGEVVAGLSPFAADCGVVENAIVFVFPEELDGDLRRVCEVTAQEIAHAFGLDHEYLCEDPMSYLEGCGDKVFQNIAAECGELEPRSCTGPGYDCQRDTQNSALLLSQRLGRRDGLGEPPEPVTGGCATAGSGGAGALAALALAAAVALSRRRRRSGRKRLASRG